MEVCRIEHNERLNLDVTYRENDFEKAKRGTNKSFSEWMMH